MAHRHPLHHHRSFSHFSEEPSPPYSTAGHDAFEPPPPPKRQRLSSMDSARRRSQSGKSATAAATIVTHSGGNITPMTVAPSDGQSRRSSASPATNPDSVLAPAARSAMTKAAGSVLGVVEVPSAGAAASEGAAASKPRRVRTGCLTCRERHLKCDEGTPDCMNCRKSNRDCKRGVRLNFIDVQVKSPPYIPPSAEWIVRFEDESRAIASEYQGGLGRYARVDPQSITPPRETELEVALRGHSNRPEPDNTQSFAVPTMSETARSSMPMSFYAAAPRDAVSTDQSLGENQLVPIQSSLDADGGDNGGNNFSLASLHDQFSLKDDAGPRSHAYKTSDVSSVASSMLPQGLGPPSNASLRAGPGQGRHAGHLNPQDGLMTPPSENAATGEREYLNSPEEIRYMQVFVEEVGVWMDSLDKDKHFSRVIPYLALKSPMLLNAFLACGVKHLTSVNPAVNDDKALFYYDTATTQLLRSLQNPDRNTAECATTAVVLNVYEIMSEKPNQRMSHIAGARALIRECGWNAKSTGIGSACFWLNIGMEVLSCLAFNWQTAWDPDQWGLDMSFLEDLENNQSGSDSNSGGGAKDKTGSNSNETATHQDEGGMGSGAHSNLGGGGEEEEWVHRIFYLVAKIANFRANIPRFQEPSPHDEEVRRQRRFVEWKRLKRLCDSWNNNCPRPMRPFGYLYPSQTQTQSAFPNVWLIKRAAVIGRLFYHTAMCLLAQINPVDPRDSEQNVAAQLHHAHQVCGIVAHTKDRGVASVAIRSLAVAACVLRDRREQEEVVAILQKINRETGWRLGKVHVELEKAWGWKPVALAVPAGLAPPQPSAQQQHQTKTPASSSASSTSVSQQQKHHPQQQQVSSRPPSAPRVTATMAPPMTTPMAPAAIASQFYPSHSAHPSPPPIMTAASASSGGGASYRPPVNPLLIKADFSLPDHPYQNWYEPPNRTSQFNTHGFWTG